MAALIVKGPPQCGQCAIGAYCGSWDFAVTCMFLNVLVKILLIVNLVALFAICSLEPFMKGVT